MEVREGKILIVEDEKDLARLIKYNLDKEGYQTLTANDGETGLIMLQSYRPDMIILDIMLPKLDGYDFLKIARKSHDTPVIILTAKKEEMDKILGLELGADDYVTKPFSIRELMARIKAIMRRASEKESRESFIRIGSLTVDLEKYEVSLKEKQVSLSPKEFEFLKCLLLARGKALTREQLLEKVWGYDESAEIDTRTIDQHIARLREKLGLEASRIITVKNIGYRFKTD